MKLSENNINDIVEMCDSHKINLLSSNELYTFEKLRDAAFFLELVDLEKAYTLLKAALSFRPNAVFAQKKLILYEKMLAAKLNGFVKIKGVTLSIDQNVSLSILRELVMENYENKEYALVRSVITPDDVVIELGAGIGFMATSISSLCNRYTAYEANPQLAQLIRSSKNYNNSNFDINNGVVLNGDGEVDFYITPDYWASSLIKPEGEHTMISVKSFDKQKIMDGISPTMLIVDIEGGECAFFKHLKCGSVRKIILEIHSKILSDKKICELYKYFIDEGFVMDFQKSSKEVLYWYR